MEKEIYTGTIDGKKITVTFYSYMNVFVAYRLMMDDYKKTYRSHLFDGINEAYSAFEKSYKIKISEMTKG